MRIQIVDDHVLFREGLASIFRSEPGFEVVALAGTVSDAVEKALATRPDIILMDFHLPDGTGVEATRRILEGHPACKIVFVTMSEKEQHLIEAIQAGAKGYLLKDMAPSQLVESLRSVYQGEGALSGLLTLRIFEKLAGKQSAEAPTEPIPGPLTPRELDVLRELATGKSNLEIGRQLFISENTVRYHVHSILEKLKLSNRNEAARYAREKGLDR